MAAGPLELWNNWATQILVLLSLVLQVLLFLFAGIRRHEASPVLRLLLWLVYQLADSTATYALGTLALKSTSREHQLSAFWAPFLLLHLGGPDNITAYSLQDNQLWLRHLLSLVVQVLGAAYVLYKHVAGNGRLVLLAAILMFAVGVVKYAERTWALRCANMDSIRSSVRKERPVKHNHSHHQDQGLEEEEQLLRRAHSQFHICKRAIVDSSVGAESDDHDTTKISGDPKIQATQLWTLMEMELSLVYDILYTKAAVIHTWFGYCIRVFSPLAIVASLVLFQLSGKDGNSSVDVVVTYVLLTGALFMELIALLSALGSTWTFAFLYSTKWNWLRYSVLCSGRWNRVRHLVVSLRRLANITGINSRYLRSSRRWSGTMGQYNMLDQCTRWDTNRSLLSRLANKLGLDMWTVEISENFKRLVFQYIDMVIEDGGVNTLGLIRKTWVQGALKHFDLDKHIQSKYVGAELQEAIIIWHIATDIFLARIPQALAAGVSARVDAVRSLSNYMMFLLVKRPFMLPGLEQNKLYERTYHSLIREWREAIKPPVHSSRLQQREKFADTLLEKHPSLKMDIENTRLVYAIQLAEKLLSTEKNSLDAVLGVWVDIVLYTANRCSRESHAKKLNNGGEFTTILWLMTEHLNQVYILRRWPSDVLPSSYV